MKIYGFKLSRTNHAHSFIIIEPTPKTCLKGPLKIDKTKVLNMKVESIAECSLLEHSAILLTYVE